MASLARAIRANVVAIEQVTMAPVLRGRDATAKEGQNLRSGMVNTTEYATTAREPRRSDGDMKFGRGALEIKFLSSASGVGSVGWDWRR